MRAIGQVEVPCPGCGGRVTVQGYDDRYVCPSCSRQWVFRRCSRYNSTSQVPRYVGRGSSFPCPWCCEKSPVPRFGDERLATAQVMRTELDQRGLILGDEVGRAQGGLLLVGGHGHPIPERSMCTLACRSDRIVISAGGGARAEYPHSDIVEFEIGGPGVVQTGGGFIGGGTGVVGAAQGMLIASALNALTTRSEINTVVKVITYSASFFLYSRAVTPQELELLFLPVVSLMAQARQQTAGGSGAGSPSSAEGDPIAQLKRLGELRDAGVLTEAEFLEAKAAMLKRLA